MRFTTERSLLVAIATGSLLGCAVDEPGISPPDGEERRFYFPSGLAIHPDSDGTRLYVTNANADLLYNKGTLQLVDVEKDPAGCAADPVGPALENCDESALIQGDDRQLTIGSFAGDIEIRKDDSRLYFTTRSGPSGVAWVALSDGMLGDLGQIEVLDEGDPVPLPAEPFGLALLESCDRPRLLVTHLTQGVVTMLDDYDDGLRTVATSPLILPPGSRAPQRAFAIAPRRRDLCAGPAYVTSSTSNQVATVIPDEARLVTGPAFSLAPPLANQFQGSEQRGTDARGIAVAQNGSRAWVAVREPPALLLVDTREQHGLPRDRVLALVEVCPQPSMVRVREDVAGRTLVYVVCFATHQIFVVDGDLMQLVDVIETGRGPATLEFDEQRNRAFVAHYAENTIGWIDLNPQNPTLHRVIRTLGLPEPLLE